MNRKTFIHRARTIENSLDSAAQITAVVMATAIMITFVFVGWAGVTLALIVREVKHTKQNPKVTLILHIVF